MIATLRSKYPGKKAMSRKKLIRAKIGDWKMLQEMEMEEQDKGCTSQSKG